MHKIAQAPVIIFPFGENGGRSIAFRPVVTNVWGKKKKQERKHQE